MIQYCSTRNIGNYFNYNKPPQIPQQISLPFKFFLQIQKPNPPNQINISNMQNLTPPHIKQQNPQKTGEEDKKKIKQILMQKMKINALKNQQNQQQQSQSIPYQMPTPSPQTITKNQPRGPTKIDTQEDFRKMPYQGKAKYDNQLKALHIAKNQNPQINIKPKRMFFQHYDINQPYAPVIQNNSNPSGRPSNIPPQMYQGVTVKPKRPWVYLGNQNIPPVQYESIHQSNFKNNGTKKIYNQNYQNNINNNNNNNLKKKQQNHIPPPKKKIITTNNKNQKDQFPADDDDQSINLSDQIALQDGQSIFASKYDTQNRVSKSKVSKKSSMRNSQLYMQQDDQLISDGTQTKKRHMSMFKDSGQQQDYGQENSQYFDQDALKTNSKHNKNKLKKQTKHKKKQQDSDDQ